METEAFQAGLFRQGAPGAAPRLLMPRWVELLPLACREHEVVGISKAQHVGAFSQSSKGCHRIVVQWNRPFPRFLLAAINPYRPLKQIDFLPANTLQFHSPTGSRSCQDSRAEGDKPFGLLPRCFKEPLLFLWRQSSSDVRCLRKLRDVLGQHRPTLGLLQHPAKDPNLHVDRTTRHAFFDPGVLVGRDVRGSDSPEGLLAEVPSQGNEPFLLELDRALRNSLLALFEVLVGSDAERQSRIRLACLSGHLAGLDLRDQLLLKVLRLAFVGCLQRLPNPFPVDGDIGPPGVISFPERHGRTSLFVGCCSSMRVFLAAALRTAALLAVLAGDLLNSLQAQPLTADRPEHSPGGPNLPAEAVRVLGTPPRTA